MGRCRSKGRHFPVEGGKGNKHKHMQIYDDFYGGKS